MMKTINYTRWSSKKQSQRNLKMPKQEKKAAKGLEILGKKLVADIEKGRNPSIEFSLRSLSNVIYDTNSKTLTLGEKQQQRTFFNVGHAKKFMQTLEVAKVGKNLLDVGKHASLRDVFYMAKRTQIGRASCRERV